MLNVLRGLLTDYCHSCLVPSRRVRLSAGFNTSPTRAIWPKCGPCPDPSLMEVHVMLALEVDILPDLLTLSA